MKNLFTAIAALAAGSAGAATMYYLDPQMGRRRRALARDKLDAASHQISDFAQAMSKRSTNRLDGLLANARTLAQPVKPLDDERLRERIRARMGHMVSHPRAIDVQVADGHVTLSGKILARDVDAMHRAVSYVAGVNSIDDQVEVHQEAGNISALQGSGRLLKNANMHFRPALPWVALAAPFAVFLSSAARKAIRQRNGMQKSSGALTH